LSTTIAQREPQTPAGPRPGARPSPGGRAASAAWTAVLAAALVAVVFEARGGLQLASTTRVVLAAVLVAAAAGAAVVLTGADRGRAWGAGTLAAFAALAVLTLVSILWAVDPPGAWDEANRTLSYVAVFGLGIALVRLAPERWASLVGAVALASAIVSGFALLTKVFPEALAEAEVYARLRDPFGYWNAVGLMAALGVPPCLWLGTRRTGHGALSALAFPALGILLVTILLAYSRGSLLALAVGLATWFALVPLRLRGAAVLGTSAVGALLVALWAFGQPGLSEDDVGLPQRAAAGHELGLVLLAVLAGLLAAGLAVGFLAASRPPSAPARRTAGAALLVVLALVPVATLTALALSERGLGGSLSSGWATLTDPNAKLPSNRAERLTAVGSVRARYWDDALQVFRDDPVAGAGADGFAVARKRHRLDEVEVRHAHGYVVQTLADLGVVGLAVSLLLLAAFGAAAGRTLELRRQGRRRPWPPERIGLLTLLAVVVVFGVHSFVDWTWFVPGTAMTALLCAGWLAGRGPAAERPARRPGLRRPRLRRSAAERRTALTAAAVLALGLVAAWQAWQPLRSASASADALEALDRRELAEARGLVRIARDRNPLSIEPLHDLAAIDTAAGRPDAARRALAEAVRMQPANPSTWLRLAEFELTVAQDPGAALEAVGPALRLDPRSRTARQVFLDASRARAAPAGPPAP
jgi:hypothetical protein